MKVYCQFGCIQLHHNGSRYICGEVDTSRMTSGEAFEAYNAAEVRPGQSTCKHPIKKRVDSGKAKADRETPKTSLTGFFLDALDDAGPPTLLRSPRETQEMVERGRALDQI